MLLSQKRVFYRTLYTVIREDPFSSQVQKEKKEEVKSEFKILEELSFLQNRKNLDEEKGSFDAQDRGN